MSSLPSDRSRSVSTTAALAVVALGALVVLTLTAPGRAQSRRPPRVATTPVSPALADDLDRACRAASAASPDAGAPADSGSTADAGASAAVEYRVPPWLLLGLPAGSRIVAADPVDRRYSLYAAAARAAPSGSPTRARAQLDLARLLVDRAIAAGDQGRTADVERAFREAERTLGALIDEQPNALGADEALSLRGFVLQSLGDMTHARRTYLALIQRFPQSRMVPHVYFSFGDYFYREGDHASARQFFERVVTFGPVANPLFAHAQLRHAQSDHASGDDTEARTRLLLAMQTLAGTAATPDGPAVERAVRELWCTLRPAAPTAGVRRRARTTLRSR